MIDLYVDTAADANGDGTTRNHSSGDNTHAYDSLSAAEADLDGTYASLSAAGDSITVWCAGTTDSTFCRWTAFGNDGTYTIHIRGDDTGGDGKYTGPLDWSTSHYHLDTSDSYSLDLRAAVDVSDLQVRNSNAAVSAPFRVYNQQVGTPSSVVSNCRLLSDADDGNARCVYLDGTQDYDIEFRNCLILKVDVDGYGFDDTIRDGVTTNVDIIHCTIYGVDSAYRGLRLFEYGTTSAGNLDVRNCAIAGFTDDYIKVDASGLTTVSGGYNASDDGDVVGGNTGDVTLGTHSDEWLDRTGSSAGDFNFTPKPGQSLQHAGDSMYATDFDIRGFARDTSNPTVGAFEIPGGGKNPFNHPLSGPFSGPVGG